MRAIVLFATIAASINAASDSAPGKLWADLKAKRERLSSLHQEFDLTRTFRTANGDQSSKSQVVVDMAQGSWREKSINGSGTRIRIFDGKELYRMEEGGDEYVRIKRRPKDGDPVPSAYLPNDVDWSKSQQVERRSCGLRDKDDECVVLEVRLKPWSRNDSPNNVTSMTQGLARISLDTANGAVFSLQILETIQARRPYQSEVVYAATRLGYGASADPSLFKVPSEAVEVKELSRWNAARIKKQLMGKPAPELNAVDIHGKPVSLAAFKGKTVLLDFWTTWCPPCRADAPSLDKLYKKYGAQDLVIVGVSVSEDRPIVEKFLKEHPHDFPILLSTENEMPTAYQIGVFPTYIVIERDGTLASAVEGDQGFSDLRKLLKKAGLEIE